MTFALRYGLAFILLLAMETGYIHMARKYNRSAVCHKQAADRHTPVAGAGIIFFIAMAIWYIAIRLNDLHQANPAFFMAGITLVAVCSFADDLRPMKVWPRLAIHIAAAMLLALQFGLFAYPWAVWSTFLIGTTWFINSYNFMDGINGMTAAYSASVLGLLLYLDIYQTHFMPPSLIVMALISIAVFAFFNYRKRALAFAGDAGSVTMGFIVAAVLICYIVATRTLTPLIFVSVYVTDTALTLVRRIVERENIFKPHHKHIYQQLCEVWKCGQLNTATGYALLQLSISICYLQMRDNTEQAIYCLSVTVCLAAAYIVLVAASEKKRQQTIF